METYLVLILCECQKIFLFTFTNDQNLKVCEHASVLSFQLIFLPPNSQFI